MCVDEGDMGMANVKKRKKKLNPLARTMILFMMLLVSSVCLFNVFNEVVLTKDLTNEINSASAAQDKLTRQKEDLSTQKENLNDTEYLIRYARAKYLATKDDGEQVFKLPEEEK